MVYLEKNDVWDAVWLRYKDSFNCTVDCDQFVSERCLDNYCYFLEKRMREDLKQAQKDAKKLVKRLRKADRKARRKAWRKDIWAKITGVFKREKKSTSSPITANAQAGSAEPMENLPQTVSDKSPAPADT